MYAVSQEFLDQMKAPVRRVLAKVTIDYTDPTQDQAIEVTASERANASFPDQTADAIMAPTHKWASLDGAWVLDGSFHLAPLPEHAFLYKMGWWTARVADHDGAFAEPYPKLTIRHPLRPVASLVVAGDSLRGEWPTAFRIRLYAEDGTLLRERVVTGNTQVIWSEPLEPPVYDVVRHELEIMAWSRPGSHAKILEFFSSLQETYLGDDLVEVRLLEESESGSGGAGLGGAVTNELTVRLVNRGGRFDVTNPDSPMRELLRPNRRVRAWLGIEDEWVPLGVFWSTEWDSEELEAMVRARDRMELLRRTMYEPGPLKQDVSLYELAQDVFTHAEMPPETYWIDPGLQDIIVPWGWVPPGSHRDALRVIAEAGFARAYCDRDGILRIQRLAAAGRSPLLDITSSDYFPPMRSPSSSISVANRVVVTASPLTPAAAPEEVARLTAEIPAGQTVVVRAQYERVPVISPSAALVDPPSGVSIMSATYGAAGARIEIRNTGGSAATVTVSISGLPLATARGEQVVVEDERSIRDLYLIEYQAPANPLVQTREHAKAIAEAVLAASSRERRQIEVEWRGNPALEAGDCIRIVGVPAEIVRQELHWAGALSARLTARRLI